MSHTAALSDVAAGRIEVALAALERSLSLLSPEGRGPAVLVRRASRLAEERGAAMSELHRLDPITHGELVEAQLAALARTAARNRGVIRNA